MWLCGLVELYCRHRCHQHHLIMLHTQLNASLCSYYFPCSSSYWSLLLFRLMAVVICRSHTLSDFNWFLLLLFLFIWLFACKCSAQKASPACSVYVMLPINKACMAERNPFHWICKDGMEQKAGHPIAAKSIKGDSRLSRMLISEKKTKGTLWKKMMMIMMWMSLKRAPKGCCRAKTRKKKRVKEETIAIM